MKTIIRGQKVRAVLINKDLEKKHLHVSVSADHLSVSGEKVKIYSRDIIALLKEEGIKAGRCIHSSVITNDSESNLLGTWSFELPTEEEESIMDTIELSQTDSEVSNELPSLKKERKKNSKKEE